MKWNQCSALKINIVFRVFLSMTPIFQCTIITVDVIIIIIIITYITQIEEEPVLPEVSKSSLLGLQVKSSVCEISLMVELWLDPVSRERKCSVTLPLPEETCL